MAYFTNVDDVIESYRHRFIPEKAQGVDDEVQFRLTGVGGGEWVVHVHDGEVDIREGTTDQPTLSLEGPTETWLQIENGELNPMAAVLTGKIKLSGSIAFATRFLGMFGREI